MTSLHASVGILFGVIAVSILLRVRRLTTFRPLIPVQVMTRIVVSTILLAIPLVTQGALRFPGFVGYGMGILGGAVLSTLALKTAVFQDREGTLTYRVHGAIGSVVTLLFLVRIAFRYLLPSSSLHTSLMNDPWSLGTYALLFSYNAALSVRLWQKLKARKNAIAFSDQGMDQ
ncbi:hypothetical protein [Ferroacidibacillus organovorans]|uniref:DUF1453 domain-containing protein n=1 Tax=Ferroacidibacillus organovorans TaxID=1765683 RepID=A0A161QGW0_9BACL|nr:hypothetical protein [Ferroacidibacillus organovorans]KYP81390.1 hypothetical protein AYJ22_01095 [Ferroacidibacillus organovorans]OAG95177.1 hypothetical protein AYW79_01695 [Ferroacidibacillus organovorans]OPG15170.1 hypothetical protein B2M26_13550 [Ferroacidibacillus organovorans]